MSASNQNHDIVIVGVKKDGAHPDLIRTIRSFSRRTDVPIRLVHAIEETSKFPSFYREILGSFDITELGRQLPERHENDARAAIEAMKAELADPESIRIQIVHSEDAAGSLIAEAQLTRAAMIVIEVAPHLYQLVPEGLSVALSLLQHAPLPVLVLRQGAGNPFEKTAPVILIADDLSAASLSAVRKAMNLATLWGHTHVIHLHVIDQSTHRTLNELAEISRTMNVVPLGTPDLVEQLEKEMKTILLHRSADYQELLKLKGSSYEAVVQVGQVASRVSRMIEDRQPDLTVFGRRQRLHQGPFGFARVPFAAMLAKSAAVLIVP